MQLIKIDDVQLWLRSGTNSRIDAKRELQNGELPEWQLQATRATYIYTT